MNRFRELKFLFIAVAAALLSACGSGAVDLPSIVPVMRSATLTGAQEVPAVVTTATGTGLVTADPTTKIIVGGITTTGVTGTAAHIHIGAVGVNGGAIITLIEIPPAGSGVWAIPAAAILTQAQYDSLLAGDLYFNVHSAANPDGEIRGQIVKAQPLSGAQVVPPVATAASGIGTVAVNHATLVMVGGIKTLGITGTAAHIHLGAAGTNGAAVFTLTESAAGSGVWVVPTTTLTAPQHSDLMAGKYYFDVHSAALPDGEIRGQIVP